MSAIAELPETKERPIIFSGPMVRAILEGRKTQTRRVVRGLPEGIKWASVIHESNYQYRFTDFDTQTVDRRCPYGRPQLPLEPPRDLLWVRETFTFGDTAPSDCETNRRVLIFRADCDGHPEAWERKNGGPGWVPGIFMPREHSRLTLGITNIRVERLQELSEADVIAEGITSIGHTPDHDCALGPEETTAHFIFRHAWNALNAKRGYSWESNPWVWVIEFRKI